MAGKGKSSAVQALENRNEVLKEYLKHGQLNAKSIEKLTKKLGVGPKYIPKLLKQALDDQEAGYQHMSVGQRRAQFIRRLHRYQEDAWKKKARSVTAQLLKIEAKVTGIDRIEAEIVDHQITVITPKDT